MPHILLGPQLSLNQLSDFQSNSASALSMSLKDFHILVVMPVQCESAVCCLGFFGSWSCLSINHQANVSSLSVRSNVHLITGLTSPLQPDASNGTL